MMLHGRNAGNSIHIGKVRLCKSAEKNCSEAGSYYSCLAYIAYTSHTAGVQMWGQMKKRRCVARLFLRVPNGGIAPRAIPPGYVPTPLCRIEIIEME